MKESEPPILTPYTFAFSWRRFLLHGAILSVGVVLGLLTWYFSKPHSIRFYETKSDHHRVIAIAPDIEIALDTHSSVAVKDSNPQQVEIFKGNVYFDIRKNVANPIEVKVGQVLIRDAGTRFSIRMHKDGSSNIAVSDGYVKVYALSGVYQINALEQADFDDTGMGMRRLVTERDIAPWRSDR